MKMMPKTIFMEVNHNKLMDHIKRVCKKNLKNKCKCCQLCPFKEDIGAFVKVVDSTKEER